MKTYSTREAAKKLGITGVALGRYIKTNKLMPAPQTVQAGKRSSYVWTEAEIEHVRQLLLKIANGRGTSYRKLRAKQKGEVQATCALPQKEKNLNRKTLIANC